ncbi:isopentenyl transferase family protein [Streptomyces sp. DG2A-72]|uniref:isopentenyl transferase family protein n=1 Tax=Streptomyces sp. DG2A-72 TaxID=3051386 RepID=UPI00265C5BBA|nr:isopentenyl transferase family protein [Streptomyces sp. DG2A-72]MDO0933475.1 isopentenyl transferase family protein [Streptomyces sp. DG2A-72]
MSDTRNPTSETHPVVHVIAGPTGVGKSAAATAMAQVTGAPIVVADRLQCFVDMATTSARAGADVPSVRRHWLGDRTVADGDLSASEAADALVTLVQQQATQHQHRFVIVEGGSISLLRELSARTAELPWRVSVRLLSLPDHDDYLATLTRRARVMLTASPPDRSLIDELATLWHDPRQRLFVASVNGFEAVLECCAKYSLDVESLGKQQLPEQLLTRMAELIAVRHAEHGRLQHRVFSEIFEDLIHEPGPDLDMMQVAV